MITIICDKCGKLIDKDDMWVNIKPTFFNCDPEDVTITIDPDGYAYHVDCVVKLKLREDPTKLSDKPIVDKSKKKPKK